VNVSLHHNCGLKATAVAGHHGASHRAALHGFVGEGVAAVVEIEQPSVVGQNNSEPMRGAGDGARGVLLAAAQILYLMLQHVVPFGCEGFRIDRDPVHRYRVIRLL